LNPCSPEIIGAYMKNIESQLDLEEMVTEKVAGFSSDKMESILNQIMFQRVQVC